MAVNYACDRCSKPAPAQQLPGSRQTTVPHGWVHLEIAQQLSWDICADCVRKTIAFLQTKEPQGG
jgi:hypothetical protein